MASASRFLLDSFRQPADSIQIQLTSHTFPAQFYSTLFSKGPKQIPIQFRFSAEAHGFNSFRFKFGELNWNRFANLNQFVQVCNSGTNPDLGNEEEGMVKSRN